MEHKLKAQSAARSGAYGAFAHLREFGTLNAFEDQTLPGGTKFFVELTETEEENSDGRIVQLRSRGQSGPLSSYFTLHLRETSLASDSRRLGGKPRALLFPGSAVFGDFVLDKEQRGIGTGVKANGGPAFFAEVLTAGAAPVFGGTIPVFPPNGGDNLRGEGPLFLVGPPLPSGESTRVQELAFENGKFDWRILDVESDLGDADPEELSGAYVVATPQDQNWTTLSVQGVGNTSIDYNWKAEQPLIGDVSQLEAPPMTGQPTEVGVTRDWSELQAVAPQEKFVTRGAIYPAGEVLYSHGWHYVYVPYNGRVPEEPTVLDGTKIVRWPCILKYERGKWSKAWAPLRLDGQVESEHRPNPNVLLADSNGIIYSVTEEEERLEGEELIPRRLLTFSGSSGATLGDELEDGELLVYQNQLYQLPADGLRRELRPLEGGNPIGFDSLPSHIPEIFGEVVRTPDTDAETLGGLKKTGVAFNLESSKDNRPLELDDTELVTARARYDLRYRYVSAGGISVDGKDLWANVEVEVVGNEPTHRRVYEKRAFVPVKRRFLGRYDGERWHILPHGLRAGLRSDSTNSPGVSVASVVYEGLPDPVSRYAIVSVDTNPF